MTWVKLDDAMFSNRKVVEVSGPAKLLHIVGICFCAQGLTDGRISKKALPTLAAQAEAKTTHVKELLAAGLWHDEGDAWMVNDYLDYNPPRSTVVDQREKKRLAGQAGGQASAQARASGSGKRSGSARKQPPSRPVPNNYPPTPQLVRVVDGVEERFMQGTGWVRTA